MSGGQVAEALLEDGRRIPFVIKENPPRGGMKYTYFAPDKSYVVQFFNNPENANDPKLHDRIRDIIGRYNPTRSEKDGGARGNSAATAQYFSDLFCWPRAIVVQPEFGIVSPAYPGNFFFGAQASDCLDLKGKDKRASWFTSPKLRNYLRPEERGDFRSMLQISLSLARAVRRMHQAGLAHSDLSCNNVLIDPVQGKCVVIDIDSLVVPGRYLPEVAGTKNYIAPEVVSSLGMEPDDPRRKLPSAYTDLFALPVLIYEYLLQRHPLQGPKCHSADPEEDDFLATGPKALFIENPHDTSNRPRDLKTTIKDLGPELEQLFLRAFVDGLHRPEERPSALEWERALQKTYDELMRCPNNACEAKYFVLHDVKQTACPFCGRRLAQGEAVQLKLKMARRGRSEQWMNCGRLTLYHGLELFGWHFSSAVFGDEKNPDRARKAYVSRQNGWFYLVNDCVEGMLSPQGNLVPAGQGILLKPGGVFKSCKNENALLFEVVGN